jgi:cell division protein FtsI/penicillin-binding protein 2
VRWNARTRILLTGTGAALVFTLFSARLIYLQVDKHEEYSRFAARKNSIRQPIYAKRGLIYDRNGEVLAENIAIRTVYADGSHIKNPRRTAEVAAPFLDIDAEDLAANLASNLDSKYLVLKKEIPAERALDLEKALQAENLRGIYAVHDSKRAHPNGFMLSHVLGFLDHERTGVQGIELACQDYLNGQDGFRHIERDRTGREIVVYRGQERSPHDGMNVHLTIDMALQAVVEDELDSAVGQLKPETAVVIIVNPKTGEILALANRPTFEPDALGEAQPDQMKNRAIIDMVEPGSTFKIVAASGVLNEGIVNPTTTVNCENGVFMYAGKPLKDHHGYGMLTVHDILMKSSNIGSAKLALKMGDQLFYEYMKRFGFGERTGIELPGEIPGLVHPPARWSKIDITRMPMGQSVAVTPLQMVMAMSVIANDGKLMAPLIVKKITDTDGKLVREFSPTVVREVIRPETAAVINTALADVVSKNGTAFLASVNGFQAAGKTGTAQKVDPKGGYMAGKYVASFVGYLPAEDPAFVCIVLLDNPQVRGETYYGGLIAAPIFSRIAEKAARHLDLRPSTPPTRVAATDSSSGAKTQ